MNRRSFFGGVGALGAGEYLSYALQPTNDRIDSLDATVTSLDSRVSVLETQAAGDSPASIPGGNTKHTDQQQGPTLAASKSRVWGPPFPTSFN